HGRGRLPVRDPDVGAQVRRRRAAQARRLLPADRGEASRTPVAARGGAPAGRRGRAWRLAPGDRVMAAPLSRSLAGVEVPDSPVVAQAIEEARERCAPYLFNHAMRSWLFAARIAQLDRVAHDGEVVALGTILHDVALNERFAGPRRFEVEAADLVRRLALDSGLSPDRARLVWDSVALNSTPSI